MDGGKAQNPLEVQPFSHVNDIDNFLNRMENRSVVVEQRRQIETEVDSYLQVKASKDRARRAAEWSTLYPALRRTVFVLLSCFIALFLFFETAEMEEPITLEGLQKGLALNQGSEQERAYEDALIAQTKSASYRDKMRQVLPISSPKLKPWVKELTSSLLSMRTEDDMELEDVGKFNASGPDAMAPKLLMVVAEEDEAAHKGRALLAAGGERPTSAQRRAAAIKGERRLTEGKLDAEYEAHANWARINHQAEEVKALSGVQSRGKSRARRGAVNGANDGASKREDVPAAPVTEAAPAEHAPVTEVGPAVRAPVTEAEAEVVKLSDLDSQLDAEYHRHQQDMQRAELAREEQTRKQTQELKAKQKEAGNKMDAEYKRHQQDVQSQMQADEIELDLQGSEEAQASLPVTLSPVKTCAALIQRSRECKWCQRIWDGKLYLSEDGMLLTAFLTDPAAGAGQGQAGLASFAALSTLANGDVLCAWLSQSFDPNTAVRNADEVKAKATVMVSRLRRSGRADEVNGFLPAVPVWEVPHLDAGSISTAPKA
eukprot:gene12745-15071_t